MQNAYVDYLYEPIILIAILSPSTLTLQERR